MKVNKGVALMSILILTFNHLVNAQKTVKTSFKKIELATYDLNSPRTKENDKVELLDYVIIDEKGLITYTKNSFYGSKQSSIQSF